MLAFTHSSLFHVRRCLTRVAAQEHALVYIYLHPHGVTHNHHSQIFFAKSLLSFFSSLTPFFCTHSSQPSSVPVRALMRRLHQKKDLYIFLLCSQFAFMQPPSSSVPVRALTHVLWPSHVKRCVGTGKRSRGWPWREQMILCV